MPLFKTVLVAFIFPFTLVVTYLFVPFSPIFKVFIFPIFPKIFWVFPETSPTKVTTPLFEVNAIIFPVKSFSNFISPEETLVFNANTLSSKVDTFPAAPAVILLRLFPSFPTTLFIVEFPDSSKLPVPWLSVLIIESIFLSFANITVPSLLKVRLSPL